jgi:dTDP-glucose 4,6-dehydratase
LGSHLCEAALRRGFSVVGIDNLSTGSPENQSLLESLALPGRYQQIIADVVQWDLNSFRPPHPIRYWFHFASPASPPLYQKLALETLSVNSRGLEKCLEGAKRLGGRVIFASTSEIYGDPELHPQSESYWGNVNTQGPRSCYDEAKRFGEALLWTWNRVHQSQHGLVRIFNTYGPRMNRSDGRVVIGFLEQALKGSPLTIFGDGTQTRSFCYVDDLIDGIWRYAESNLSEAINLGNPTEFTILELADAVQRLFPSKPLGHRHLDMPQDDPRRRRPNIDKAKTLLSWEPKVPLESGLKRMLDSLSK